MSHGVGRRLIISWPGCGNEPAMTPIMVCFVHDLLGSIPRRSTCHARADVVHYIVGIADVCCINRDRSQCLQNVIDQNPSASSSCVWIGIASSITPLKFDKRIDQVIVDVIRILEGRCWLTRCTQGLLNALHLLFLWRVRFLRLEQILLRFGSLRERFRNQWIWMRNMWKFSLIVESNDEVSKEAITGISLERDVRWVEQDSTFGRFVPQNNTRQCLD